MLEEEIEFHQEELFEKATLDMNPTDTIFRSYKEPHARNHLSNPADHSMKEVENDKIQCNSWSLPFRDAMNVSVTKKNNHPFAVEDRDLLLRSRATDDFGDNSSTKSSEMKHDNANTSRSPDGKDKFDPNADEQTRPRHHGSNSSAFMENSVHANHGGREYHSYYPPGAQLMPPLPHGPHYPYYHPFFHPVPRHPSHLLKPQPKSILSASVTMDSDDYNASLGNTQGSEEAIHSNHLIPPHPWPQPSHLQMYYYGPPPPYYPIPPNHGYTQRKQKNVSPTKPSTLQPRTTLRGEAPKSTSSSPTSRKRKKISMDSDDHVEKLTEFAKRARSESLNVEKKTDVPPKVLERRERKNAQSRLRAANLKERISYILSKLPSERNAEEVSILHTFEERRAKKNGRSRERASFRKEELKRIVSKPEDLWTQEEKTFMVETMVAKYKKNEGDRLRRRKIKADGSQSENREDDTLSTTSSSAYASNKMLNVIKKDGENIQDRLRKKDGLHQAIPFHVGSQYLSPRPLDLKKGRSDELLHIPLTPCVQLTPILGNIALSHDEQMPDYGKMFDITPLLDGSSKDFLCDSRCSGVQGNDVGNSQPSSSSYLANVVDIHTPKTPVTQKNLPFIHLTSPLGLSPLHLPRRQRNNDGMYDTLTGFGIDYNAHENQDMIAVSFSTDSHCETKF